MALSIIALAKSQFGQTVELIKDTKQDLMGGNFKFADIDSLTGTEITAVIVKKQTVDTQTREGRITSFPSYILVDIDVDLTEDDVIKTQKEMFFVHEVSLRHDNITGAVSSGPGYKRAELEIYEFL